LPTQPFEGAAVGIEDLDMVFIGHQDLAAVSDRDPLRIGQQIFPGHIPVPEGVFQKEGIIEERDLGLRIPPGSRAAAGAQKPQK
jgi:hypothetical protein